MPDTPRKPGYNPAIDGLRGIAILGVWLFHLHPPWMPGGFLGVDAFFVLSGFLIHGIVSTDLESGRFSFREFYLRRVLRLLANATLTLCVTLVLWNLCLPPNAAIQPGLHGLFTLANLSNVFVWKHLGSYWGDAAESAPLTHFWSLGIEEQFYLFFPAFLFLLHRKRWVNLGSLAVPTILSLALWIHGSRHHPSGTFYLLPTRAWELLLGAAAAHWARSSPGARRLPRATGWFGLALVLGSLVAVPHADSSLGAMALIPTVGTAGVLVSLRDPTHSLTRVLSWPALVGLGLMSYSLYLWHWPLIVLGRLLANYRNLPETTGAVAGGILSVGAAYAAYRWVEKPLRDSSRSRPKRLAWLGGGMALTTVLCVLSWRRHSEVDPDQRFEPMTFSGRLYDCSTPQDPRWSESPRYWGCRIPVPPADRPPEPWRTGGLRTSGDSATPRVVVFGSSHALMYSKVIDDLCRERQMPVAFLSAGNGIPALFVNEGSPLFPGRDDGAAFDETRRRYLREWRPETLLVIDRWDAWSGKDLERDLGAFLEEVCPLARTVVLVTQVPVLRVGENENIRGWVHWRRGTDSALPRILPDAREPYRRESVGILQRLQERFPNLRIVDSASRFYREDGSVRYAEGRRFFYTDDDHLNDTGAAEISDLLQQSLPAR
ncbi:MAG: acyltransferase family protein [Verrucomicrobia bacterium]|nr:acyltransferase family protein [Verrucomicrobiota bacterium]